MAAPVTCEDPPDCAMVDSTAVRAHPSAAGIKGGRKNRPSAERVAVRRPIYKLADGAGGLYALMLTAGLVHDLHGGRAQLASTLLMHRLIADTAYNANNLRDFLAAQGTETVISPNPTLDLAGV